MDALLAPVLAGWPLLALAPAFVLLRFDLVAGWLFKPSAVSDGDFVAEVWIERDGQPDTTMYRQRFATEACAVQHARHYAVLLSYALSGDADVTIGDGVRPLCPLERQRFTRMWTTALPGDPDHHGEPFTAHPTVQDGGARR